MDLEGFPQKVLTNSIPDVGVDGVGDVFENTLSKAITDGVSVEVCLQGENRTE